MDVDVCVCVCVDPRMTIVVVVGREIGLCELEKGETSCHGWVGMHRIRMHPDVLSVE